MKDADINVFAALNEISSREKRSIAKRISDVLPGIEAALDAGNTHEEVFEALKKGGIETTFSTYRGSFYRARKKLQGADKLAPPERQAEPEKQLNAPPLAAPSKPDFLSMTFKYKPGEIRRRHYVD